MPNNDDQLQQQYQDILNKYASSITPPVEPEPTPGPTLEPEPDSQPEEVKTLPPVEPEPELNPVLESVSESTPEPEPETEPEPEISPIKEIIITSPSIPKPELETENDLLKQPVVPPIYFPPTPEVDKPSNFFKYLFYFSIIIFVGVVSALFYNFTNNQNTNIPTEDTPTPTSEPTSFCEVGDKKYQVNENFPSEDGCNSCSCGSDLTVTCTQMACISPTSIQSTTSAKPTLKATTGKVYKDIKYGYQFECPTTAKYLVEATSVNGNKIPYKQESCTTATTSVVISVYDNTVVHNFGDVSSQVSPNKKYVVTLEGEDASIISTFKFL
jgi:hypothetical protein